ncbi:MAG TPA: type II toxin-antitoxin system RelE/ParE family toxin [Alphaproteobacteria bacterium]|nr:type II toxin-antitoxin system RelE/ParE family toxin [Alphaproteobacteria bacterium]
MAHRILFAPEARDDLRAIYIFIAERAGEARAMAYIERIEAYCRGLADFPERGTRRDDLLPGLRIVGFQRRVSIAFHVDSARVTIDRILYGGRDLEALVDDA